MNARDRTDDELSQLRIPPHSLEAEQSVLGGLLLDNRAWDRAGDLLADSDFYRFEHRLIFATIGALINATRPADVITVYEHLQRTGNGDECGGLAYLNSLAASVPSSANMRRYAEIVRERAILRKLIATNEEIIGQAWESDDPAGLIDRAATMLSELQRRQTRKAPRPLGDILIERIERISDLHTGKAESGWPTRIPSLDRMFNGGLRPGMVYVLAARPSIGKSSLVEHIAIELAMQDLPVLLLSQEMPDGEVADRAISTMGGIDYGVLQSGKLNDLEWSQLSEVVERGRQLPFHIDDQAALRLADIKAKARMVKGLKVLILDYLQLSASTGERSNRNAEIEEISRGLKALAKDMGIAVIELSQLNREVEKRANKRPNLSDLRDSGAIEQDADVVMFLWPVREFEGEGRKILGLGVDKNRQGKRGELGLDFFGATQCWRESTADIRPEPRRAARDDL
jgi:replicative DNA helicase